MTDADTAIKNKTATLIKATENALEEIPIKSPMLEKSDYQGKHPNQATGLSLIGLFKDKYPIQQKTDDEIGSHNSSNLKMSSLLQ